MIESCDLVHEMVAIRFSASVIASDIEQPDRADLDKLPPIRRLPRSSEMQIASGDCLPPPSQPFLEGFEPKIPATGHEA